MALVILVFSNVIDGCIETITEGETDCLLIWLMLGRSVSNDSDIDGD